MSLRFVLALSAALAAAAASSLPAAAMTAEDLVAKNLEARGGLAKLRAIKTMHAVGTTRREGGLDATIESWAIAPSRFRAEYSMQGMTSVRAWDGSQAWSISPFGGRREPQKISADDAKPLIERSDIAGPLVDYEAKGSAIEYLGTEDVDGTQAHKLRVTFKNGDTQYRYLDPDAFLEIRVVDHHTVRGQDDVSTTDLGEYEQVDGIYFPFEFGSNHFDKVELNRPIDEAIFAFPGGAR